LTVLTSSPVALASPPAIHDRRKIAAIYARVSSTGQLGREGDNDGYSLPAQIEAGKRQAKLLGAKVVKVYVERAESARSDNRPVLQQMMRELPSLGVGILIVHKVDRLARNRLDDATLYQKLVGMGITLVSVSENIDDTPAGRLMHGMLASFAEYYSNNLATEVRKGLNRKHEIGGTPFKPPIGYVSVRKVIDGHSVATVELDPERAPLIRMAFDLYATGEYSVRALVEILRERGLRSVGTAKRPPVPLVRSRVHRLLRNPYYIGVVEFCGKRVVGRHKELVDQATFDRVGALLEAAKISGDRPQKHTPYLSGTVRCGQCGARLVYGRHRSHTGTIYEYFSCTKRAARGNGGTCTSAHYRVDHVERAIENLYASLRIPRDVQDTIRADLARDLDERITVVRKEAARHERKLRELEANQTKLVQMAYQGLVSDSVLASEQARLEAEQQTVRSLLTHSELHHDTIQEALREALRRLKRPHQHYLTASDIERRLANRAIFERILIDHDGEISGVEFTEVFEALTAWYPIGQPTAPKTRRRDKSCPPDPKTENPGPLSENRGSKLTKMVGETGFEPATARPPAGCATRLRHSPWCCYVDQSGRRESNPP
jgi:site-specific DNA recombinase